MQTSMTGLAINRIKPYLSRPEDYFFSNITRSALQ